MPSTPSTMPQMALSPVYRHAQRVLGAWLEQSHAAARQQAVRVRSALTPLDAVERHRFARWLAWLCVAAESRRLDIGRRLRRLDATLWCAVEAALATLPPTARPVASVSGSHARHG